MNLKNILINKYQTHQQKMKSIKVIICILDNQQVLEQIGNEQLMNTGPLKACDLVSSAFVINTTIQNASSILVLTKEFEFLEDSCFKLSVTVDG